MSRTTTRWARVEYQPDLKHPVEPIPLGVVVLCTSTELGVGVGAVMGREPRRDAQPAELGRIGALGFAQLLGWVAAIARDVQQAQRDRKDPFALLCSRYRWNLYVMEPELYEPSPRENFLDTSARLYEKHTKESFPLSSGLRAPLDLEKQLSLRPAGPWVSALDYAAVV